ncbi:MAG TPA: FAD-binding oxidoreductase [Actinomycetota bacterium]
MSLPRSAKVVVIGAGVHGLSTSWHLAKELESRGLGSGEDVVVLDKTGVGAGPSGLACGVIRNNYFQPAMRELMAHSVEVWESDPEAFHYHPVGYLQVAPEVMHEDVAAIHEQQRAIGYASDLIEGEDECRTYMESIFSDWQARNVTVVLHERKGGYAESMPSMLGLRAKGEALGVEVLAPVTVTGFELDGSAVSRVVTDRGTIACERVVVAAGPWVRDLWHMLELPGTVTVRGRDGRDHERPMWTYWCLVEGTLGVDPSYLLDNDGNLPPVVHLDTDAPLLDDTDGSLVTDELWGIYYKPDFNFGGVQGGAMPWVVDQPADEVAVDPYGPESAEFVVGEGFERMWTSALAHAHKRFEGKRGLYRRAPTGGIGAFTPDSFPVFDTFHENVHVIADSNHGYKMIGVGALAAREVLGERQALFEPFRFSRYARGALHPVSHSPFPWS